MIEEPEFRARLAELDEMHARVEAIGEGVYSFRALFGAAVGGGDFLQRASDLDVIVSATLGISSGLEAAIGEPLPDLLRVYARLVECEATLLKRLLVKMWQEREGDEPAAGRRRVELKGYVECRAVARKFRQELTRLH